MTDSAIGRILDIKLPGDVLTASSYAKQLCEAGVIGANHIDVVTNVIQRFETRDFIYMGGHEKVEEILAVGSTVVIDTTGDPDMQRGKCATSGLPIIGQDHDTGCHVWASLNKVTDLPNILRQYLTPDMKRVVMVDDKSAVLVESKKLLVNTSDAQFNIPQTSYVWCRRDPKTREKLPEGIESESQLVDMFGDRLSMIESIAELEVRANSLYLLDLDRTLLNTDRWFDELQRRIAAMAEAMVR